MATAHSALHDVDTGVCIPLKLLMNFSLFQYLTTTFFARRREQRVRLLILVAFVSFASLVPFALPGDRGHARNLNDISEVCSVLTFLLQITIVTRDVSRRIKIKSVLRLMWCGELLVAASLGVLVTNFIDLVAPVIDMDLVALLDSIVLHVSLLFVVGFRFYFLGMAKGVASIWKSQRAEIVVYALFLTHEVPFLILDYVTHLDWHHVKGFWMRVTIMLCLSLTIRARYSSKTSKHGATTSGFGGGPFKSQLEQRGSLHKGSELAYVDHPSRRARPDPRSSRARSRQHHLSSDD